MTHDLTNCPTCGNDRLYQLGDGRYKCSACKRKISPGRRRTRLSPKAMNAIISGFAVGDPASAVATDSDINLKTVQHYYGRIRELLAADREQQLTECYGSAEVSPQMFNESGLQETWKNAVSLGCLVDHENEIELLMTGSREHKHAQIKTASVAGWLVAADPKAMDEVDLDRIICLPGNAARELARSFWKSAKSHLTAYSGGFRKNFRLYLREMEFRNNMESPEAAREYIGELLGRNSSTLTGEEDA